MLKTLSQLAKSSHFLYQTPHPTSRKISLGLNLIRPSEKMLGFEISCFDRKRLTLLYHDIFARQIYLFRTASKPPVIFDCGANIGMATLYFKWLYPEARIEAFEPDPGTFELLQNNVRRNGLTDVTTHNCALWDKSGNIDFFIDPLVPGSLGMSTDPLRLNGKRIQVPSRELSEFVQGPVDFLKLDVEGAEDRIVDDLVSSGKINFIREMVIEYHHHIGNHRSCLAEFLRKLECAQFEYQIQATLNPPFSKGRPQDVLITAYRDHVA